MKIATLGPEGTFSQEAVKKIDATAEIVFTRTIKDVFIEVEDGRADKGVVPVENSIGGAVNFTLDALLEHDLLIEAEEVIPVIHNLMAKSKLPLEKIETLYLHEQTYSQCEEFIRKNLSATRVIETLSNAESAKIVMENDDNSACIGPEIAAKTYNLEIIKRAVQDNRFNVTRFFVVSKNQTEPTGYDKTSITIYPQVDRPGLLYEMLGLFVKDKINLTKIESRPSKGRLGDYIFYVDFVGHVTDANAQKVLDNLKEMAFVKVLGSYERIF